MEEKKVKRKFDKVSAAIIISLLFITGITVRQSQKAGDNMVYLTEDCRAGFYFEPVYMAEDCGYMIRLHRDRTFSLWNNMSSFLQIDDGEDDFYRWSDGMLILEFSNSDGTLCFRKEDERLVFQRDLSVFPEGIHMLDRMIFNKWRR